MKFDDVANIWTIDPGSLSNVARGQVYFARVKHLVDEFFAGRQERSEMIKGNRFCRGHLRKAVGCRSAMLSQNRQIKGLLERADRRLAAQRALAAMPKRGRHLRDLEMKIEGLRVRISEQDQKLAELYDMINGRHKDGLSNREPVAVRELDGSAAKRAK